MFLIKIKLSICKNSSYSWLHTKILELLVLLSVTFIKETRVVLLSMTKNGSQPLLIGNMKTISSILSWIYQYSSSQGMIWASFIDFVLGSISNPFKLKEFSDKINAWTVVQDWFTVLEIKWFPGMEYSEEKRSEMMKNDQL